MEVRTPLQRPNQCHTLICFNCLCACLHPPGVAHLPHYPLCIFTCVLCLSVASSFCSWNLPACVSLLLPVSCSCFLVFPGFDSSACTDPESACRSVPCLTSLDYWPLPAFDLSFACPCIRNQRLLLRHCLHLGHTWNVIVRSGHDWPSRLGQAPQRHLLPRSQHWKAGGVASWSWPNATTKHC